MASGKKNYFRHSNQARKDPKIMDLITNFGKEAYFHFFCIVEMCAESASDKFPENGKFVFHRRTLCAEMMVTNSRLVHHLVAIRSSHLGDHVVNENMVEIHIPNLSKYMGKYETKCESNSPNKIKENKTKINKIKHNGDHVSKPSAASSDAIAVLNEFNRICEKELKPTKSNLKEINARLNEKYGLNDFVDVITYKHRQWAENAEFRQYLRPQTLFSGKFGSYLDAARDPGAKSREDKLRDFFTSQGVEPAQI